MALRDKGDSDTKWHLGIAVQPLLALEQIVYRSSLDLCLQLDKRSPEFTWVLLAPAQLLFKVRVSVLGEGRGHT